LITTAYFSVDDPAYTSVRELSLRKRLDLNEHEKEKTTKGIGPKKSSCGNEVESATISLRTRLVTIKPASANHTARVFAIRANVDVFQLRQRHSSSTDTSISFFPVVDVRYKSNQDVVTSFCTTS
jgi:hypothetical protein